MIENEKKRSIRNHANRNIGYLFDQLKICYNDRGNGLMQAACPCKQHGGDRNNTTAFSWRSDIGKWVCWSHHCEESRGNDIFGLVSSILGTSFKETFQWINDTLTNKNVDVTVLAAEPDSVKSVTLHIHEPLAEDNLKFLQPDPTYLLNRGFDLNVLRKYEVGLWNRYGTYMHDRVVFPIRDHDGHLVGYTGRTIHEKSYFENRGLEYIKWLHGRYFNRIPHPSEPHLFTGSILYNLFRARRYLEPDRRLILVEGPLDGMKLEEAGIHNWVATLSTNLCHGHRTLLVKCGVKDLFVAYDNDDPNKYKDGKSPGEKGWEKTKRIVGDIFNLHKVELPPDSDCGELPVPELQRIFKDILC